MFSIPRCRFARAMHRPKLLIDIHQQKGSETKRKTKRKGKKSCTAPHRENAPELRPLSCSIYAFWSVEFRSDLNAATACLTHPACPCLPCPLLLMRTAPQSCAKKDRRPGLDSHCPVYVLPCFPFLLSPSLCMCVQQQQDALFCFVGLAEINSRTAKLARPTHTHTYHDPISAHAKPATGEAD